MGSREKEVARSTATAGDGGAHATWAMARVHPCFSAASRRVTRSGHRGFTAASTGRRPDGRAGSNRDAEDMFGTSYLLDAIRTADVMHPGIIGCDPHTSVEEVAEQMSRLGIHAVAIRDETDRTPTMISDLDVVAAISSGEYGLQARDVAAEATVTIPSRHSLREAARLMTEHGLSHLVVIDEDSGAPCGVVSSTDVLAAYASVACD